MLARGAERGEDKPPGEEELQRVRTFVGSDGLRLFPRTARPCSENESAVDLGGIAKGYAADRAIELYRAMNLKAAS
jgi:thiamine biosynthesis lipoprotein ApbE